MGSKLKMGTAVLITPGTEHQTMPGAHCREGTQLHGTIADVLDDGTITVGGFDHNGNPFSARGIQLVSKAKDANKGATFAELAD